MTTNDADPSGPWCVRKPDRRPEILKQIALEWGARPDLRLRPADVEVLWHLAPDTCQQVLDALVDSQVLAAQQDGSYVLHH